MKKLIVALLLAAGTVAAQAGEHFAYRHHGWGFRPSVSFYYGGYPYAGWYAPGYAYSYSPACSYGYYPGYSYDTAYSRPNYAVNGALMGALTGGIIGNSIHHQGWEGAGIGAAAGLLLGGLAEHDARASERAYYAAPPVYQVQPNSIANAPTVNTAPVAPAAPPVQNSAPTVYRSTGSSSMSGANSLFGR